MNKTANCLKMLQYLNSGRVYKISELAERLETNPRNIIEYRNELENAGYVIISIAGKYGGYKLDETSTLPTVKLTADEKLALVEGAGYLAARNDFLHKTQYESAMSKVYSAVNHTDNREVLPTVITRFPLAMSEEELTSRYQTMSSCIANRQKVQLEYRSNDNVVRKRIVHPYKLSGFNDDLEKRLIALKPEIIIDLSGKSPNIHFLIDDMIKKSQTLNSINRTYGVHPSRWNMYANKIKLII